VRLLAALLLTFVVGASAYAREPGVGQVLIPGITLGQANAVPLAPGFRLASRTNYNDAVLLDNNGLPTGLRFYTPSEIVIATWVPDWKLLGGGYKAFVVAPFASTTLVRDAPVPRPARGSFSSSGPGNPKLQFIDLSWILGEGFYANAGFGVYFPVGQYSASSPVNVGAPFWTFEPTAAFSYFKDGFTASLQAAYDTNTVNSWTNYLSGDQFVVNATFMRMFGRVNVGPVGYWLKQTTVDANYGTNVLAGQTALPGQQLAVGGTVSTQVGKLTLQLMVTQDVYAQNATQGTKGWLSLAYRFK
jgi:hypothetical protein